MNYDMLSGYPEAQAEKIARHYAHMAQTALTLLKIIEMAKGLPKGANLDQAEEAAQHLLGQIKDAHFYDLGIKLQWPAKN